LNGNGGDAEVSSHGLLDFTGLVDLTSLYGQTGTLLLDPFNVTISTGTTTINHSGSGTVTYTPTSTSTSVINASDLITQLGSANVKITTGSGGSSSNGNITVSAPVAWSSGKTLTLNASKAIAINAAITSTSNGLSNGTPNGGLILTAGSSSAITAT